MEQIKEQFPLWDTIQEKLESLREHINFESLKEKIPEYYETLKSTTAQDVVSDFQQLKISPATVTVSVFTLTSIVVLSQLFNSKSKAEKANKKKKKKSTKKLSKAQKANLQIEEILNFVEETYVPQIDDYLENYEQLSKDQLEYKYNYFEEMLLKELMKLDGVDVSETPVLRENRKKVIRFIQEHQKRLDRFKKEVNI